METVNVKQLAKALSIINYVRPIFANLAMQRMQGLDSKKGWSYGTKEFENLFAIGPQGKGEIYYGGNRREFIVEKVFLGKEEKVSVKLEGFTEMPMTPGEFLSQVISWNGKDFTQLLIDSWKHYATGDSVPEVPALKEVKPLSLKEKKSGFSGLMVGLQNMGIERENRNNILEAWRFNRNLAIEFARKMRDLVRERKVMAMKAFADVDKNNISLAETKNALVAFDDLCVPHFERALVHLSEYEDVRMISERLFMEDSSAAGFNYEKLDLEGVIRRILQSRMLVDVYNNLDLGLAYSEVYKILPIYKLREATLLNSYAVLIEMEEWANGLKSNYSEQELSQAVNEFQPQFIAYINELYKPLISELLAVAQRKKQEDALDDILDAQRQIAANLDVIAAGTTVTAAATSITATKNIIDWLKSK